MTDKEKEWRYNIAKEMKHMLLDRQPNVNIPIRHKQSTAHLLSMVNRILQEDMPIDKIDRWTGYIQGVMCCRGFATVDEFRKLVSTHRPKKPTLREKFDELVKRFKN